MSGTARRASAASAARRLSAASPVPVQVRETPLHWADTFTEHKINSVIYERDEEYDRSSLEDDSKRLKIGLGSGSSKTTDTETGFATGAQAYTVHTPDSTLGTPSSLLSTPGSAHENVTRQRSLTNVFKAKEEERVIIVCHDEGDNEIPCSEESFNKASALPTPSSVLDDPTKDSKETGSLLIKVSDKLNAMPKHHPVVLTNSIPAEDEAIIQESMKGYLKTNSDSPTPDSLFSDSEAEEAGTSTKISPSVLDDKRRIYRKHARAVRQSLDDADVIEKNVGQTSKQLTLSVPNLYALSGSDASSTRSTPRISRTPRLQPKPSPRLSPRLAHTVHNVKKKISEAVKHEMSTFMSDQMVSVSFKSLETFIEDQNISGLQSYLTTRSVLIDDRDENGATALIIAAQRGLPDFCIQLIAHGADIHAEDNDQWCALLAATKEGHDAVVATLLDHGANIHQKDMGGWTALMWASYKGHASLAKLLLERGADPNTQGPHHMTCLMWAAGRGHTEVVEDLLSKGAKVNVGDKFGTTPLIWACRKGYLSICQALLSHGANTDATGMYSWTALLVATRGNYIELVRLLLEHKPNVNALDKDGGTALTIACKEGYTEIAQALLQAGAYVNIQDRNQDSNLIYAARGGHKTVVEALMKKYADVDLVGKDRKNALYWAVEKGHTSVVKLLLTANPDLEHCTKDGDTALLRAVRSKNAEIVQLLIDKRCKVNGADKKGDTCLHIAMRGRSKRIVEILLRNPKNSQMLYRPNKAGETPYNIDLAHQKTILGQIFGARRLNTNEDNENMLGYDLYSSSLADILSEPSLSMPIAVGLYAKWGSGKSFLIRKLKEEMRSFTRQWVEPLFTFSPLAFLLVLHLGVLVGLLVGAPMKDWRVGLGIGSSVFILATIFLITVWQGSKRYEFHPWFALSVHMARYMTSLTLVMKVIFCSPPGPQYRDWKDSLSVRPLKFVFAEGAKPGSTAAGESSVVQMLGSLFDKVEQEYGVFATRLYRAFRPKPQGITSPMKYRSLCCIPYVVLYFVTVVCVLTVSILTAKYGFHEFHGAGTAESAVENEEVEDAMPTITGIAGEEDAGEEDDDVSNESNEELGTDDSTDPYYRPYHGYLINPLLYTSIALVAVVLVANLHTLFRMLVSLVFSHRRHLLRAVSKLDTLKAEGYLHTLKGEVMLMVEMVKCLDAFSEQQTRLVAIVDGLDTCEQEKVLSVLDAVNSLFTDTAAPFIIVLAIDPHIITKAIELHVHRVFSESNISGHDYLRNIVHLPFYLQNSGLRKVKQAQQVAEKARNRSGANIWLDVEGDSVSMATTSAMGGISHIPANRRLSVESGVSLGPGARRNTSKGSRRLLKQSDSLASSIGSNLNRVGGAQDLTKVLLTDDYFSDINPRSMRRLMNVVYITGRLLKAFHIDFNWYHLASWINIIEQWPYRASWIILYHDVHEDTIEDKISLKDLYDKIKNLIPVSKDMEPLLAMDKDEKKFEIFLSMHKSSLHVSDMKVFLPFTINLDPFIRKVIKEDQPQFDDAVPAFNASVGQQWGYNQPPFDVASKASTLTRRQQAQRSNLKISTGSLPHHASLNPLMWGYPPPAPNYMNSSLTSQVGGSMDFVPPPVTHFNLPDLDTILSENPEKHLSSMTLEDLCLLLTKVVGLNSTLLSKYQETFRNNNINGKVLAHCDLDDLKKELSMSFGDWELFKMVVQCLRDSEATAEEEDFITRNVRFGAPLALDGGLGGGGSLHFGDETPMSSLPSDSSSSRRGNAHEVPVETPTLTEIS